MKTISQKEKRVFLEEALNSWVCNFFISLLRLEISDIG